MVLWVVRFRNELALARAEGDGIIDPMQADFLMSPGTFKTGS